MDWLKARVVEPVTADGEAARVVEQDTQRLPPLDSTGYYEAAGTFVQPDPATLDEEAAARALLWDFPR